MFTIRHTSILAAYSITFSTGTSHHQGEYVLCVGVSAGSGYSVTPHMLPARRLSSECKLMISTGYMHGSATGTDISRMNLTTKYEALSYDTNVRLASQICNIIYTL